MILFKFLKGAMFNNKSQDDDREIPGKYDVIEVSRHIINYSNDIQSTIYNTKLQKILFLVQEAFLVKYEGTQACFNEELVAWDYGPVVSESHKAFRGNGMTNIPKIITIPVLKLIEVDLNMNIMIIGMMRLVKVTLN